MRSGANLETPDWRIDVLVVGPLENNVYVVSDRLSDQAVIIDAAAEPSRIIAKADGLDVVAVLTTHGHHDHVGGARAVCDHLDIPFRLHPADQDLAGLTTTAPLSDGMTIAVGGASLSVRHTPGHTPGSVTFAAPGVLFTGDTLFPGGPGATRFPYSDFDMIMDSLDHRLFVDDDATLVLPGHGAHTTIGAERPFLETWRARRW